MSLGLACAVAAAAGSAAAAPRASAVDPVVVGDAMPEPLTSLPGDVARGRSIVGDRRVGLCLLCHAGPFPEPASQGTLAPDLAGAGDRWSTGQLRLRVADARRLNPATPMPSYLGSGERRVGRAWRGRPVLTAQQVEDVVAYLGTLRR